MNKKAEKFNEMLEKAEIKAFQTEEMQDDFHTMIYRSNMQISGQNLPMALILDDSIYAMCRVWVAVKVVKDSNRESVAQYLNETNQRYKVFKYYITEDGDIVLDCCMPANDDQFDPELVRTILDVVLRHLEEKYAELMKTVWAEGAEK